MAAYPGGVYGGTLTQQVPSGGPAAVNDSTAKMPIGVKFLFNGAIFRYVKHNTGSGAVTPAVGAPAYAQALSPAATAVAQPIFTVTPDFTDSLFSKMAVGVYISIPTNNYYCCIQVGGKASCKVVGAVGGQVLISDSDNAFTIVAEGGALVQIPMAKVMTGASASGISQAWLMNMDW